MKQAEFQSLLGQNGFQIVGNNGFSVLGGVPVALSWTSGGTVQLQLPVDAAVWKPIKKPIKSALPKGCRPTFSGNKLMVAMKVKHAEELLPLTNRALDALRSAGVTISESCPLCHSGGCDMAAPLKGVYHPTHKRCLDMAVANLAENAQENELNGSIGTGILGAILGMLVGIIPSFVSILLLERIYALLFALIPFCSYHGYRLFKGKMNRSALVVSIVLSLVGVYVLEFALLGYLLMDEYMLTFGEMLSIMPEFILDGETWAWLTQDAIMEFIFVALGIWIVWSQISQTNSGNVKNMQQVVSAAMPYGYQETVSVPSSTSDGTDL